MFLFLQLIGLWFLFGSICTDYKVKKWIEEDSIPKWMIKTLKKK